MRLIDADALKKKARYAFESNTGGHIPPVVSADDIDDAPTIEAEPVKRGPWIGDGYYEKPCVCSYCGAEAHYISTFKETYDYDWEENLQSTGFEEICEYIKSDYCPNCGAKMDLEV